jgi:anhydro-N-acetylmuramic acid kinase
MIAIGLMSGTSFDGIDAAVVRIVPRGDAYEFELVRHETFPFDDDVRQALASALPPNDAGAAMIAALHRALGRAFSTAAVSIARAEPVDFVASHGQTIWHDGARHVTLQIGDAFAIREAIGASVCFDFRSADCAAGGHGAPLVPYVDALLFADANEDRAAVNIGGIANVTLLPRGGETIGFDTGPGNMLLDAFVRDRTEGKLTYDRDGAMAAAGTVDGDLLASMLSDEFFSLPPPKTTGRERFGAQYLLRFGERLGRLRLEDGLATLAELTAASIAQAIAAGGLHRPRVIVSGGGARNASILDRIAGRLAEARVEASDSMGVPAEAKEAIAFAVLGYETLRGRASNVPRVTGAAHATPLGAIAPHRLRELLERIESECRTPS